jgi:hypothetical protein
LSDLPAVNLGILAAGMVITAPVLGLRPFLDFLLTTEKVPNPTRVTFWPFFSADLTALSVESSALEASALLNPVPDAILSISSAFVIYSFPPFMKKLISNEIRINKDCHNSIKEEILLSSQKCMFRLRKTHASQEAVSASLPGKRGGIFAEKCATYCGGTERT